jgi:hypothetical protein
MIIRKKLDDSLLFMAPVVVPDLRRVGKDADGGYIISERSISAAQGMLSFGVNNDWSFDQQWHQLKPKDPIHAYDGTISPGRMSDELRQSYRDFFGGVATHYPVNVAAATQTGTSGFDDIMIRINRDSLFIKMDIEGGEWQLTDSILQHAGKITGMTIEFHNTYRFRELFCDTIQRYQQHFHVIHIHPNTSCAYADDNFPTVVEISFLNRSLWSGTDTRKECHCPDLDQANVIGTNDVALYWE